MRAGHRRAYDGVQEADRARDEEKCEGKGGGGSVSQGGLDWPGGFEGGRWMWY